MIRLLLQQRAEVYVHRMILQIANSRCFVAHLTPRHQHWVKLFIKNTDKEQYLCCERVLFLFVGYLSPCLFPIAQTQPAIRSSSFLNFIFFCLFSPKSFPSTWANIGERSRNVLKKKPQWRNGIRTPLWRYLPVACPLQLFFWVRRPATAET